MRGWSPEAEGCGLVQPGEGEAKGGFCCCLPLPNGGYSEDGARLFLEMHRHKLEHGKIQLGMRGKNFTTMVVKY